MSSRDFGFDCGRREKLRQSRTEMKQPLQSTGKTGKVVQIADWGPQIDADEGSKTLSPGRAFRFDNSYRGLHAQTATVTGTGVSPTSTRTTERGKQMK